MISNYISSAYPVFCYLSLTASFAMLIMSRRWNSAVSILVLLAVSFIVLFIPVRGLYLYKYFYGVFGTLSITSVLLVIRFIAKKILNNRPALFDREIPAILYSAAIAGLILYPASLGFFPFDPYRFGFHPRFLLVLILCLTIIAWMVSVRFAAMLPIIAVIAYNLKILESENLWDYIIDPFVVIYAVGWILYSSVKYLRG